MASNARKWLGVACTAVGYYIVHEGAHLVVALLLGVFQSLRILGLGMQVVIDAAVLTNFQLAVFSIVGSLATLVVGYALVLCRKQILGSQNKVLKAICYYFTIGFLLSDPLYLSVLCGFFGGGDMNGIVLFGIPEIAVRLAYGAVLAANLLLVVKVVYPAYKRSFANQ